MQLYIYYIFAHKKKSQSTPLSIIQVEDTNPDPPSENECTTIVLTRIFSQQCKPSYIKKKQRRSTIHVLSVEEIQSKPPLQIKLHSTNILF